MNNPAIIIQARTGSSRLPKKVLKKIFTQPMLYYVIRRCQQSKKCNDVIVATTTKKRDAPIVKIATSLTAKSYRGEENDTLKRYFDTATSFNVDPVVRITGDCPLIDPVIIDELLDVYRIDNDLDYLTNNVSNTGYPRGFDCEVISLQALKKAFEETEPEEKYYREHVTSYIANHPDIFNNKVIEPPNALKRPDLRLCVDEIEDFQLIQKIYSFFYPREFFSLSEIIAYLDKYPEIARLNCHVQQRNT